MKDKKWWDLKLTQANPTAEDHPSVPQEMLFFFSTGPKEPEGSLKVYSQNPEKRLLMLHLCNEWGELGDRKHIWARRNGKSSLSQQEEIPIAWPGWLDTRSAVPIPVRPEIQEDLPPTKWYYLYTVNCITLYFHITIFSLHIYFSLPPSQMLKSKSLF